MGFQSSYNQSAFDMRPVNYYNKQVIQHARRATWTNYMLTFEVWWLNRGRLCLGSGIGLGQHYTKSTEHVMDSVGIESHSLYQGKEWAARFRLVNAKVRIARNFGAYVGIGAGYDGLVATGAYYTFVGRDSR